MGLRGLHSVPQRVHLHMLLTCPHLTQVLLPSLGAGEYALHEGHQTSLGFILDMIYQMIYHIFKS